MDPGLRRDDGKRDSAIKVFDIKDPETSSGRCAFDDSLNADNWLII